MKGRVRGVLGLVQGPTGRPHHLRKPTPLGGPVWAPPLTPRRHLLDGHRPISGAGHSTTRLHRRGPSLDQCRRRTCPSVLRLPSFLHSIPQCGLQERTDMFHLRSSRRLLVINFIARGGTRARPRSIKDHPPRHPRILLRGHNRLYTEVTLGTCLRLL